MNNIELKFVNDEFSINLNGNVVGKEKDIDKAIEVFKNLVNDNRIVRFKDWDSIKNDISDIESSYLNINYEYKTLEYGSMKYFYRTDKTFYIKDGNMIPLIGRFDLFNFVVHLIKDKKIENEIEILEFLFNVLKGKATYRIQDNKLIISSVGFNYGSCEYDFSTSKMNKGATIEKCNFNLFKDYVGDIIKF